MKKKQPERIIRAYCRGRLSDAARTEYRRGFLKKKNKKQKRN